MSSVEFGAGMLTMTNGASLWVEPGRFDLGPGSRLSMFDADLAVVGSPTSQLDLNAGAFLGMTPGSSLFATDDVFLDSGRLSLAPGVVLTAIDSVLDFADDIEHAFGPTSDGVLVLEGTSTVELDKLEEGARIVLRDTAKARIQDFDESEWITNAFPPGGQPSAVVLQSLGASLTLVFASPRRPRPVGHGPVRSRAVAPRAAAWADMTASGEACVTCGGLASRTSQRIR